MRVVHVSASYCRQDGGPSEVLRGLLPALVAAGHDVHLVTTDKGLTSKERQLTPVEHTTVLPFVGPYSLSFARGFRRAVRRAVAGADVVHVHGVDNYAALVGMQEAVRAGVPWVVQPHGAWDAYHRGQGAWKKRLWGRLLQDRLVGRSARVVVSSTREHDHALVAFPTTTPVVVPLGVDQALLAIDTEWAKRAGVLFLGRVAHKKHLDVLIHAMAVVSAQHPEVTLTVAGPLDADLTYDPKALVDELHLGAHVRFVGQVDKAQRHDLLATHRVFALPSDDESFGMAAVEAAAAGMAVVASPHVGAMADAAQAGVCEVTPAMPQDVAQAVIQAVSRQDAPHHLRAYVAERCTWEHAATILADAYGEVIA